MIGHSVETKNITRSANLRATVDLCLRLKITDVFCGDILFLPRHRAEMRVLKIVLSCSTCLAETERGVCLITRNRRCGRERTLEPDAERPLRGSRRTAVHLDFQDLEAAVNRIGRVKWNVVPGPEFVEVQTRPPCASRMDRVIASPKPVP